MLSQSKGIGNELCVVVVVCVVVVAKFDFEIFCITRYCMA